MPVSRLVLAETTALERARSQEWGIPDSASAGSEGEVFLVHEWGQANQEPLNEFHSFAPFV